MSAYANDRFGTAILLLFPLLLLTTVAIDRIASLLLGYHPGSLFVWGVWIELRPVTRVATGLLSLVSSDLLTQLAWLAAATIAMLSMSFSFRALAVGFNLLGFFFLVGSGIAANEGTSAIPLSLGAFIATRHTLYLALFTLGLASCIYGTASVVHRARKSRRQREHGQLEQFQR